MSVVIGSVVACKAVAKFGFDLWFVESAVRVKVFFEFETEFESGWMFKEIPRFADHVVLQPVGARHVFGSQSHFTSWA